MDCEYLFPGKGLVLTTGLAVLLTISACDENNEADVDDAAIVVTKPLEGYDFKSLKTYGLPDKIAIIRRPGDDTAIQLSADTEASVIQQVETNLNARGYQRIAGLDSGAPDFFVELGVMGTVVTDVYYDYWYPTWSYYYDPWYGGYYTSGWGPSAVPYVVSAEIGSLIINIADPNNPNLAIAEIPTIWAGVSVGLMNNTTEHEKSVRVAQDIDQMFHQSPYFASGEN
ncbi:MAG TPA: DUF4136 domain-containing protein [Oligoflexus sp.]|uniref:DUF4136 domain-containing protein n=1 Tax=Oligoflexus sp. TaxID=1971216 RepID=UPI002D44AA63|nr:DUF4136 domain-containing protein [Oligoflexus sp.]HYX37766.1 DUF4136 domain-containing protein [Oligoflexus sp.]